MIGFNINKTKERAADFAAFRLEGKTPDEAELLTLKNEFMRQGPHIKAWNFDSYQRRFECRDVRYKDHPYRGRPAIKGRNFKLRPCGECSWDLVKKFSNELLALRQREEADRESANVIQTRNSEIKGRLGNMVGRAMANLVGISESSTPFLTLRLQGDEAMIGKALKALKDAGIKLPE